MHYDAGGRDASARLQSLWEIVQPYLANYAVSLFPHMATLEHDAASKTGTVPEAWIEHGVKAALMAVAMISVDVDLPQTEAMARRLDKQFKAWPTWEELRCGLKHLRELMRSEMEGRLFFGIPKNLALYYNQEKPFGDAVYEKFPSARTDLTEAGSCLACSRNMAAGFHLMRVIEVGMWEFGRDRQIPLAQSQKIEFAEWGAIIGELEVAVKAIQQWGNSEPKEQAHRFYNSLLAELRSFNDGWRRHLAHVRTTEVPLQDNDALALWGHVERFMLKLSEKVAEGLYTPLKWDAQPWVELNGSTAKSG